MRKTAEEWVNNIEVARQQATIEGESYAYIVQAILAQGRAEGRTEGIKECVKALANATDGTGLAAPNRNNFVHILMGLLAENSQEPSDGDTGGPDENRQ